MHPMPREKLLESGSDALSDEELLAILLRTGRPGIGVVEFARQVLCHFGGVRGLLEAGHEDFLLCPGLGKSRYAELASVLELSRRYLQSGLKRGEVISDPVTSRQFLQLKLRSRKQEVFACLFLDNQHCLIQYEEMFYGTIDGASVHPREIARRGLELNAAAVIFSHNHPSGIAEPSQADRRITERLISVLAMLDIRVLDHLVVGDNDVISFAERGLL